ASDIGPGLKRHIWVGKDTATQQGTTLTAQLMNELQKGLLFSTSGTRTVGSNKDIYTLDIQGMKEFGIFNGLNLLLRVDGINQYSNVVLKIDDREYQIFRLKNGNYKYFEKGMLTPGRDYLIHFDGTQFTIVQDFNFGTEPGTLLEGAELAKILGVEKIGGLITETGIKQVGYAYYDVATKFYYLCKNTNSQTYIDNNNYTAFSNKSLLDRLENLYEVKQQTVNINNGYLKFIKTGKIVSCFMFIHDNNGYNLSFSDDAALATYPSGFEPKSEYTNTEFPLSTDSRNNLNGETRMVLRATTINLFGTVGKNFKQLKGTATYATN
ncbi:MAG: hypothetical protein HXM47_03560, partial [Pseudoleptotrichia goodfellowii]|nr:hypothetical protein [Pseudoleptotrichia goodfellowii]